MQIYIKYFLFYSIILLFCYSVSIVAYNWYVTEPVNSSFALRILFGSLNPILTLLTGVAISPVLFAEVLSVAAVATALVSRFRTKIVE